ncbi:universal stress protein [Nesterenkonia pannonica]|uniref:universal stress protein n=1 Tax=Nesterenkonia pannonica TaxID=1548602 RepID=UPI002164D5BC|nr:universal stress protein [Nesterenkonia pannonica]
MVGVVPRAGPLGEGVVQRRKAELERDLQAEAAWIGTHFPHLTIEAAVDPGDPIAQLTAAARDAQLTVVGTRGRSGFTGALMGSVSRGVVLRAAYPVMIVPDLKDERLSDQPEPQQQA